MSPKGNQHEILKIALNVYWARRLPAISCLQPKPLIRLTPDTYLQPDFVFDPKASGIRGLTAETARLVVEIADFSLGYDLGRKAALYDVVRHCRSFGDRCGEARHAHSTASRARQATARSWWWNTAAVPRAEPALAVTLGDLDLH